VTDQWQPPDEAQTYTDDIATAHYDGRGALVLSARRSPDGSFTSARLSARRSPDRPMFHYGRFAAAIQVPTGPGIWPAWWLLGEDDVFGWPDCAEIDIMEAPSGPATRGQVHQGTHLPAREGPGEVAVGVPSSAGEWDDGLHVYAVSWSPGELEFTIDDRTTGRVTRADVESAGGRWRFDERRLSPVLSLAVAGWAGEPSGWAEQSMRIAWVRIWG
jgi:beta-glucanase (GH16 family)